MATKQITDDSFQSDVLNSDKPVLVDFWAEWCGPCKMIGPSLEEISDELGEQVTIAKLNIDEQSRCARPLRRARHPDDDPVQERRAGRDQGRRRAQGPDQGVAGGRVWPDGRNRPALTQAGCSGLPHTPALAGSV